MALDIPLNEVAGLFQMDGLRAGTHRFKVSTSSFSRSMLIKSVWSVLIKPSFHPSALMVVVRCVDGYGPNPPWTKGVLITPSLNPTRDDLPQPVALESADDAVAECWWTPPTALDTASSSATAPSRRRSISGIPMILTACDWREPSSPLRRRSPGGRRILPASFLNTWRQYAKG